MAKYLYLPKIGMNMKEGTIVEWLIKPGDIVEKEQLICRAETDKAVQDMYATASGRVYKLLAQEGDTVPCQGKIALLLDEGEEYSEDKKSELASEEKKKTASADEPEAPFPAAGSRGRERISPLARKMANDFGIPLEKLSAAEQGKRIVKADVLRVKRELNKASETKAEAEQNKGDRFVQFSHMRKVIAKRMTESAASKPRVSLTATVDCENLYELREKLKKIQPITYNEIILKACAAALKMHPDMNCVRQTDGYLIKEDINIGTAVDTERGLLVPVIRNVDKKGLFELAEEFAKLTTRAREGTLSADELNGGTFSVTNLGMLGVESFDPIINAPECMILGVGCMRSVPAVVNGQICVRRCMQISLAFDHAVFDGAAAAKVLRDINIMLEDPRMMLA